MRTLYTLSAFVVLSLVASVAGAQSPITYLDWDVLASDTLAPVYSEVVPLESDYRLNDYSVTLEYPTWAPLNSREETLAKRYISQIGDSINVKHYISIRRGEGLLNLYFLPIVRRNGRLEKLVSAQIMINPRQKEDVSAARWKTTTAKERYAEHSVLSEGKWHKISVTEDGMYRLTPATLKSMGYSDTKNVRVYGYGGHELNNVLNPDNEIDDLNEIPLYVASDGSLLFWANGLVSWSGTERNFNAYANEACYFVTSAETERTDIAYEEAYTQVVLDTVSTRNAHALYEKDNYTLFHAGRNLVDGSLYGGGDYRNYTFRNIHSLGDEKLTVVFDATNVVTPLTIYVNGQQVGSRRSISAPGKYMYFTEAKYKNIDVSPYADGTTAWKIKLSTEGGGSDVSAALDYIAFNYTANLTTEDGFVQFGGSGNVEHYTGITSGEGASSKVLVMRLDSHGVPVSLVPTTEDVSGLGFSTNKAGDSFVAFDADYDFPEPDIEKSIANQDLHAIDSVDMVIIVPANGKFTAEAERLAQAHKKYQGLSCIVVRADQIYNEFSSGTPDVTAYRRFLKMLYDRGANDGLQPRWLLLFGDCAWDNRMKSTAWSQYSQDDFLLCWESENSYSDTDAFCWEDYMGLMDDGEGGTPSKDVADISVGRFPATSLEQAKTMVDKTIDYLMGYEAGEWLNHVVVVGDDDGTSNEQMINANIIADQIMNGYTGTGECPLRVEKIMLDSYARESTQTGYKYPAVTEKLKQCLENGTLLINYTGHAAAYTLTHENVYTLSELNSWTFPYMPVWFTAACDTQPFDTQIDNLGEESLRKAGGGAVAYIGTTHTVYSSQNFTLNKWFNDYVFNTDKTGRRYSLGESLCIAKSQMAASGREGSEWQNKLQYNLMGDPAIVVGNPTNKVVLDSINGQAVSTVPQMKAGSIVRLYGHVEDDLLRTMSDFEGLVSYRLYDSMDTLVTRGNSGNDKFSYKAWDKTITYGTAQVKDGIFQTQFTMPRDIKYTNLNGRLEFFAVSDNDSIRANGHSQEFVVGGSSHELDKDSIGPTMYIYLNDENFQNGGSVNSMPLFGANLSDDAGIQYMGNGIGHDLMLVVDNSTEYTFNLNDYFVSDDEIYGKGTVMYYIPELSEGRHSLTFRSWDMLNNTSIDSLDFVVGTDLQPQMTLRMKQDPESGRPTFCINYNYPGLECEFTIDIYSIAGKKLYSRTVTAAGDKTGYIELTWDGYTSGGSKVNDGLYAARVRVSYNGNSDKREKKFLLWGNN